MELAFDSESECLRLNIALAFSRKGMVNARCWLTLGQLMVDVKVATRIGGVGDVGQVL